MKKNFKGSILIWSIFLVLFVSFSFLFISSGIKTTIERNKTNLLTKNYDLGNITSKQTNIGNDEIYEVLYFDSFSGSLKENESIKFEFLNANSGTFYIENGGPINYKNYEGSVLKSNFIITKTGILNQNVNSSMVLNNLGGLTNFGIKFNTSSGIVFPYNYYKIIKTIGGTSFVKEFGEIK